MKIEGPPEDTPVVEGRILNQDDARLCPCHQTIPQHAADIEIVSECLTCQVIFRSDECYKGHFLTNRLCDEVFKKGSKVNQGVRFLFPHFRIVFCFYSTMLNFRSRFSETTILYCTLCQVVYYGNVDQFFTHCYDHLEDKDFTLTKLPRKFKVIQSLTYPEHSPITVLAAYHCRISKEIFVSLGDKKNHTCNFDQPSR